MRTNPACDQHHIRSELQRTTENFYTDAVFDEQRDYSTGPWVGVTKFDQSCVSLTNGWSSPRMINEPGEPLDFALQKEDMNPNIIRVFRGFGLPLQTVYIIVDCLTFGDTDVPYTGHTKTPLVFSIVAFNRDIHKYSRFDPSARISSFSLIDSSGDVSKRYTTDSACLEAANEGSESSGLSSFFNWRTNRWDGDCVYSTYYLRNGALSGRQSSCTKTVTWTR
jgi:hypothetical protein